MTNIDQNEKQPGRDLDTLVAERVLGFTLQRRYEAGETITQGFRAPIYGVYRITPKPYSTSATDAWQVADELLGQGYEMEISKTRKGEYLVQFIGAEDESGSHRIYRGKSVSIAHAICLAALKTTGWEE